jgi:hypothetical protein
MKIYKLSAILLGTLLLLVSSCRDEFATLNSNPSNVTKADPSFLFAQAVINFEPSGYLLWYYNTPMTYTFGQVGTPTGGFTPQYTLETATGDQASNYLNVLLYARDLAHQRSLMSAAVSAQYANIASAIDVMTVYMGIFATDMYGDIPFTQACTARYGGTLTPQFDRVSDLYTLWLKTLDNAVQTFTTSTNQIFPGTQDVVYGGKPAQWAKLANSMKLKIAARLISQNKPLALTIASQVASASCGVLNGSSDDFLFNKANSVSNGDQDKVYHWNNGFLTSTAASQRVINFMVQNQDPRVRFFYQKNQWNSKVVQAFFSAEKNVPSYILNNVNYTTDANGIHHFVSWKGIGEPWVRYYGLPVEMNAQQNAAQYGDYFDPNRVKLTTTYSYTPYSMFQYKMVVGTNTFTLPTLPGDPVVQDNINPVPWYGMYMSTAEVNLYLAEFSLLGANLPQSASSYFNAALTASVTEYDHLANLNKLPYYGKTYGYDPNEVSIELRPGEIATMLANPAYQLTGNTASDLEKVYIQQILHFTYQPSDQFVTIRRSGCPKVGSNLIAWQDYTAGGVPSNAVPRRFEVVAPTPTDLMYNVKVAAYKTEGFTSGTQLPGTTLNSERVWQDINAPQFGAGPNQ